MHFYPQIISTKAKTKLRKCLKYVSFTVDEQQASKTLDDLLSTVLKTVPPLLTPPAQKICSSLRHIAFSDEICVERENAPWTSYE